MLIDVVNRTREKLYFRGCPALVSFGIEHLWDKDVPPLVVCFVPTKDQFGPPQPIRPKPGTPFGAGMNPRPTALVKCGFDVYLRAHGPILADGTSQAPQDYQLLYALQSQVFLALTGVFQAAWRVLGGETVNDLAGASKLGQAYRFHCEGEFPYVESDFSAAVDCGDYSWILAESARYDINVLMTAPSGDPVIGTQPTIVVPS